jgi:fumarate hydratase subunit alpha
MLDEDGFVAAVVEMIRRAETCLPKDVVRALKKMEKTEGSRTAKFQYSLMLKNLMVARRRGYPICQDTGTLTFFVRMGRKLRLDFNLYEALRRAVSIATTEVPLRINVVDPIHRTPMKTNTGAGQPAVHCEMVGGEELTIDLLVRGSGAENCGKFSMLTPTEGLEGIERMVLETIAQAGGKPCPPTIVGVGIGGFMETACIMAKHALTRPLGTLNPDPDLRRLERKIELAANGLDIGPMGLGGATTVLGVHIEKAACHTASLPVAVALQCWAARRARAVLKGGSLRLVEP